MSLSCQNSEFFVVTLKLEFGLKLDITVPQVAQNAYVFGNFLDGQFFPIAVNEISKSTNLVNTVLINYLFYLKSK